MGVFIADVIGQEIVAMMHRLYEDKHAVQRKRHNACKRKLRVGECGSGSRGCV